MKKNLINTLLQRPLPLFQKKILFFSEFRFEDLDQKYLKNHNQK